MAKQEPDGWGDEVDDQSPSMRILATCIIIVWLLFWAAIGFVAENCH